VLQEYNGHHVVDIIYAQFYTKDLRLITVSKFLEEMVQKFYWKIKNLKNFIQQNGNHILLIFSQNQIYNFY
jgi:hypothetical protein